MHFQRTIEDPENLENHARYRILTFLADKLNSSVSRDIVVADPGDLLEEVQSLTAVLTRDSEVVAVSCLPSRDLSITIVVESDPTDMNENALMQDVKLSSPVPSSSKMTVDQSDLSQSGSVSAANGGTYEWSDWVKRETISTTFNIEQISGRRKIPKQTVKNHIQTICTLLRSIHQPSESDSAQSQYMYLSRVFLFYIHTSCGDKMDRRLRQVEERHLFDNLDRLEVAVQLSDPDHDAQKKSNLGSKLQKRIRKVLSSAARIAQFPGIAFPIPHVSITTSKDFTNGEAFYAFKHLLLIWRDFIVRFKELQPHDSLTWPEMDVFVNLILALAAVKAKHLKRIFQACSAGVTLQSTDLADFMSQSAEEQDLFKLHRHCSDPSDLNWILDLQVELYLLCITSAKHWKRLTSSSLSKRLSSLNWKIVMVSYKGYQDSIREDSWKDAVRWCFDPKNTATPELKQKVEEDIEVLETTLELAPEDVMHKHIHAETLLCSLIVMAHLEDRMDDPFRHLSQFIVSSRMHCSSCALNVDMLTYKMELLLQDRPSPFIAQSGRLWAGQTVLPLFLRPDLVQAITERLRQHMVQNISTYTLKQSQNLQSTAAAAEEEQEMPKDAIAQALVLGSAESDSEGNASDIG